jgi:hypothetical protein
VWDNEQEKWYISIVDAVEVLTESANPLRYWSDLKIKLSKAGSQLSQNLGQLKMQSEDGKSYLTDVADVEQLFRLIQSIPSPKAEPFKQWLATNLELALNTLAEATTAELSKEHKPETGQENRNIRTPDLAQIKLSLFFHPNLIL